MIDFSPLLVEPASRKTEPREAAIELVSTTSLPEPEKPEVAVAWGCALATEVLLRDEAEWHTADALLKRMQGRAGNLRLDTVDTDVPFFDSDADREDFFARQLHPDEIRKIPAGRERLDRRLLVGLGGVGARVDGARVRSIHDLGALIVRDTSSVPQQPADQR